MNVFTKYEIYDVFVSDYTLKRVKVVCKNEAFKRNIISSYGEKDYQKKIIIDSKHFN